MECFSNKRTIGYRHAAIWLTLLFMAGSIAVVARAEEPSTKARDDSQLIDDDGKTLWESPTHGRPVKVAYLPPGCQIILALRPAELLARPESEKIVAALGPTGANAFHSLEQTAGIPLRDVEELVVGWQIGHDGKWDTALVVMAKPADVTKAFEALSSSAKPESYEEQNYLLLGDRAYWQPKSAEGHVLVVVSKSATNDVIDLAGSPPPLRRDVERLLAHTDASRQVTLLLTPSFLFGEGAGIFTGQFAPLHDSLFWFLGDEFTAAELSAHWGDDFFIELAATTNLDVPPNKALNQLAGRLNKAPDLITAFIAKLTPSEFGRAIVARFPDMIHALVTYTRHRVGRDFVILRSYLPATAGENLLLGAELTLAESQRGMKSAAGPTADVTTAKSVHYRLQKHTSLRFTKDTLEAALKMLADDIGVEIIIRGPDLQLDGITKNQSFGIDLADKPAEEILVQILRLANPDKTATGPADPKQKLVYVVQPKSPGGPDAIFVTTRAAAKKRGDPIPAVFTGK
jgi:hypothetical protein